MTETHTPSHPSSSATSLKVKKRSAGPSWPIVLVIVFLLIACVAAGVAWFQQKRLDNIGREVATQLKGLTTQVIDARRDATQALSLVQSQSNRIAQMEQAQLEAKSQYLTLEQLLAGTNKGMEDSMLANDIDRLLTIASQQLRLAGNVNNAIMSLEAAQSLLIRADNPRFAAVQRAISLNLDRLRAVPFVDISQLSNRLETLSGLLARAPLVLPDAAAPKVVSEHAIAKRQPQPVATLPSQTIDSTKSWWETVLDRSLSWSKSAAVIVVREFAEVVSIQRVSDANALLMSPEQGGLLRANLGTRVLTAQMALLLHQAPVWKAELSKIEQSLKVRFEQNSSDTQAAMRLVKELSAVQITVSLPDISDSLSALESVRASEPTPTGGQ